MPVYGFRRFGVAAVDEQDAERVSLVSLPVRLDATSMGPPDDRGRVARCALEFATELS